MEFTYIAFGWLLGILGTVVIEAWRRRKKRKEVKRAFLIELRQFQRRLVSVTYKLVSRFGEFDVAFVKWFAERLEVYSPVWAKDVERKIIDLSRQGPDAIAEYVDMELKRRKRGRGLSLKELELPFIRANLDTLGYFDTDFSESILDILFEVAVFNAHVADARVSFRSTFDSSLSEYNKLAIDSNLDVEYRFACLRAKIIVDRIHDLLSDSAAKA